MKLFVFAFMCGVALVGCESSGVVQSESPAAIQLNQEASYKNGAPQTVRTELIRFTLNGFTGLARVYEFGGANAGVEVIVFKRQPGPGLFPPRTDPRRFAVWALRKDGRKITAQFRQSPGPMNAGEVYDTDVAEFGPAIRLRGIDQITLQIDDTRRSFKIVP
jgi:hypothetical protein